MKRPSVSASRDGRYSSTLRCLWLFASACRRFPTTSSAWRSTSLAYVITVPEMTYVLNQVWSDNINVPEMMLLLFGFYVLVVTLLSAGLRALEHRLALPGYGE